MLSALIALLAPVALGQFAANCTQYCATIQTVCTGPNSQFSGPGIDASLEPLFCGAVCGVYNMSGTAGDTSGDTFQCRAYHLAVAQNSTAPSDVAAHCLHAGFYGGGVCGNNHDGAGPTLLSSAIDFQCDLVRAKCDNMTNMDTCYNNYKDYSLFVMDSFNPNNTKALFHDTGNSLQCRTYNIFETLMGGATAGPCGDGAAISSACAVNCTDFCTLEGSACGWGTSGNNQFATMDACMSACAGWQAAPVNMKQPIAMGDTSGCRWYHLSVALSSSTNAATHCPHTGNWPDKTNGFCVPSCDYYCNTIQTACTGANTVFANNTECMTACGNYTWLNAPYTRPVTKGNNLQCRTYHAEVAFVSASNAAIHCPHASPMSTPDWCGASAASSVKVGVATAFLVLVGVASSFLGF